jgi:hypothetical protein
MAATSVSKENLFSTVRAILIFAGTFVVGHNLFGHPIDSSTWQIIVGSVISLGMALWGIVTKDTPVEGLESFFRSFIQGIGGILVADGILNNATLDAILGLLTAIAPLLQSFAAKAKVVQIAAGNAKPDASGTLKKVA